MTPVRMSEVPSWDRTRKESQVSAGTLPSRAPRWKQPWLWPSMLPCALSRWGPGAEPSVVLDLKGPLRVEPLGPDAVLGLGVGEVPRLEVGEAHADGDLPVDRDDAAAARAQDQHRGGVGGGLAVGGRVEHRAGLDPAVQRQVVDVAVGVGGRLLAGVVAAGGVGA